MSKKNIPNIRTLRNDIDKIDENILNLLHKRGTIIHKVKKYKKDHNVKVFLPQREKQLLNKILKINNSIFPDESLLKIYGEILSVSRKIQQDLKIGFLGPEGTFSHIAAENIFGTQSIYFPLNSIRAVFTEIDSDQIDYGVVPIENSNEGIVGYTLDMLVEFNYYIVQEFYLEITNNIISRENSLEKIKILYSHPQPIAQCRTFIENNLKNAKIIETFSTSEAARLSFLKKNSGAVSSKKAAGKYHLNILAEKINDNPNNYTRFIVISNKLNKIKEDIDCKTSIVIGVKDKPGALFSILEPFNKYKVNMTKIESRPTKKKAWEYIFFIEFIGKLNSKKVKSALDEVENISTYLKILGAYPKAIQ